MIGRTLGNFRIVSKLGDGGMGSVYRATDEMLDREVALKVLKPELARQAALIERFRQEAIALARLNHPRIAALHGFERHGEELVMVMEFLPGETLEAIVQRSGRIAWTRAAELCSDILEALDHAHDKGVVHRDIKPANAMLTRDGRVKVMDFGIARLKDKNRQTKMGHAVGTPMYMSPEQLRGEEVDGRADLYAVGAVLFELVTGRMAFESDSDYGLMMKQLNDPPPSASAIVSEVPAAIDVIIATSMAKRREERYRDALAMRDALRRALGSVTAETRRPRTPAPETRLVGDALTTTADHSTPVPGAAAATRLAAGTSGGAAETRLAGAGVPETRLESGGRVHAGETLTVPGADEQVPWTKDWRTWASAAGLLFAIGLAVQTFSAEPGASESGDSVVAVVPDPRPLPREVAPETAQTSAPGLTVAADPPPSATGSVAPVVVPPAAVPRPISGTRVGGARTKDGSGSGGRTTPAPPRSGTDSVRQQSPVVPPPVTPSPQPVTESPKDPPADRDDDAGSARGIAAAIGEFAGAVSSRNAGAVQGVVRGDGNFVAQFVSLVREGRLQMSVSGDPSVDVSGGRASARFSASLNVRSPFGANRRRNASFAAELARSGDSWRVVSVRPTGTVDLR
jgi:serine/threonine-protein kinase